MSFGAPAELLQDERTILAVNLAKAALIDPLSIDEVTWAKLKNRFSESELVELVFIISMNIAVHLMGYLLDVDTPDFERPLIDVK